MWRRRENAFIQRPGSAQPVSGHEGDEGDEGAKDPYAENTLRRANGPNLIFKDVTEDGDQSEQSEERRERKGRTKTSRR